MSQDPSTTEQGRAAKRQHEGSEEWEAAKRKPLPTTIADVLIRTNELLDEQLELKEKRAIIDQQIQKSEEELIQVWQRQADLEDEKERNRIESRKTEIKKKEEELERRRELYEKKQDDYDKETRDVEKAARLDAVLEKLRTDIQTVRNENKELIRQKNEKKSREDTLKNDIGQQRYDMWRLLEKISRQLLSPKHGLKLAYTTPKQRPTVAAPITKDIAMEIARKALSGEELPVEYLNSLISTPTKDVVKNAANYESREVGKLNSELRFLEVKLIKTLRDIKSVHLREVQIAEKKQELEALNVQNRDLKSALKDDATTESLQYKQSIAKENLKMLTEFANTLPQLDHNIWEFDDTEED